jgi:hypothetical protein
MLPASRGLSFVHRSQALTAAIIEPGLVLFSCTAPTSLFGAGSSWSDHGLLETSPRYRCLRSMGLASGVDLRAEVGGGGAGAGVGEVAGEDWLEERAEDDLGAAVGY